MDFNIVTAKYDTLEAKIKEKLDILFNEKKIRKEEYAEIYVNLMNRTLGEVINSFLIDAQISKIDKENQLIDEKIISEQKNHLIQDKQIQKMNEEITMLQAQEQTEAARKDMIIRQTQGFDDNIRIKLFESSMNAWAMMFGSGFLLDSNGDPLKPQFITNDKTTCLWNELIAHSNTSTTCQG